MILHMAWSVHPIINHRHGGQVNREGRHGPGTPIQTIKDRYGGHRTQAHYNCGG